MDEDDGERRGGDLAFFSLSLSRSRSRSFSRALSCSRCLSLSRDRERLLLWRYTGEGERRDLGGEKYTRIGFFHTGAPKQMCVEVFRVPLLTCTEGSVCAGFVICCFSSSSLVSVPSLSLLASLDLYPSLCLGLCPVLGLGARAESLS